MIAAEERQDLLLRAQSGDREALENFCRENLGLVHMAARRFTGRGVEYEDLFQIGCLGLCKAVKNFDPGAGVLFSTYGVPVILGELKRYFRDNGPIKISRILKQNGALLARARETLLARTDREPTVEELAAEAGLSCDEAVLALDAARPVLSLNHRLSDEEDGELEQLLGVDDSERLHDRLLLGELLTRLPERERAILQLRFFKNRTQTQVAAALGISQVQVSRLERGILQKLRRQAEES